MNFDLAIRRVPDHPIPGVQFFDCTPLLAAPALFREAVAQLADPFRGSNIDLVIAPEARGYYIAPAVAMELGAGFVPARKPGKLPARVHSFQAGIADRKGVVDDGQAVSGLPTTYRKPYEYEMHIDDVPTGKNVLILDDLLAKGGTTLACCGLADKAGAQVVGCAFLIELVGLGGAALLAPRNVFSLLKY